MNYIILLREQSTHYQCLRRRREGERGRNLEEIVAAAAAKLLQSCLTFCNAMDCSLPGSSVHEIFPGKNNGVGCHALLQGIFLTEGSNLNLLHLLHWQAGSLPLTPPGKFKQWLMTSQIWEEIQTSKFMKSLSSLKFQLKMFFFKTHYNKTV